MDVISVYLIGAWRVEPCPPLARAAPRTSRSPFLSSCRTLTSIWTPISSIRQGSNIYKSVGTHRQASSPAAFVSNGRLGHSLLRSCLADLAATPLACEESMA